MARWAPSTDDKEVSRTDSGNIRSKPEITHHHENPKGFREGK
jgi:hypothetical protein